MQTLRKHLALLAIAACAVALAGCDKKEEAAAPASSSTPPASSAPAAPSSSSAAPAAASGSATASIPSECEAYVKKVDACVSKLGQGNPAMAAVKQQLDAARSAWSSMTDKSQLAAQCKQSNDLFSQSSAQMGC